MAVITHQSLLSFLVAFAVISVVVADSCPNFECGLGIIYDGFFTDPEYTLDVFPDSVTFYKFNPNTINVDFAWAKLNDPNFQHAEEDCYKLCELYNKNVTKGDADDMAIYWTLQITCADNGGQCYCFNSEACSHKDDSYNPTRAMPGDYANYIFAANFTSGKLCPPPKQKGDPHFSGGDGSRYDFSGIPDRNYAIVSDAHFQMNGFFGGRYDIWGKEMKALTWIRKVGILFGHHTLVLEAREGPDAEYLDGYMARIAADGNEVELSAAGTSAPLWDGALIRWVSAMERSGNDLVDVYELVVGDLVTVRFTLRPEVMKLRKRNDAAVHFGIEVVYSMFSPAIHGVLGQTYRKEFAGRLGQQKLVWSDLLKAMVVPGDNAEGFIHGTVADYEVSELLAADCKYCRFTRAETVDSETSITIDLVGGATGGGPSTRRFLDVE